jgi:peptidoglycan/LPS O-acetylase OafA/YrhL
MPPRSRTHFDFLDGLRGLAAISVAWGHVRQSYFLIPPGGEANFHLAVDFFFGLSGFVLAHAYAHRLSNGLGLWEFARLRFIRLYPLIVLGTLIGLAVMSLHFFENGNGDWLGAALSTVLGAFNLPSWFMAQASVFPMDEPQWSLFFEVIANLVYGAVSVVLSRSVLLAIVVLGAASLVYAGLKLGSLNVGFWKEHFWGGLPRVTYSFFVGVALYAAPRPARLSPAVAALLVAALGVLLFVPLRLSLLAEFAIVLVGLPLILHFSASVRASGLMMRACFFLGAISYPLYMIHMPLVRLMEAVKHRIDPDAAHGLILAPLALVMLIAAGWLAWKVWDVPIRAWLGRKPGFPVRRPSVDGGDAAR